MSTVLAGPALARKIRPEFFKSWEDLYKMQNDRIGRFCKMGLSADDFQSLFGFGETPVYPSYTPWGEAPKTDPHEYRTFTATQKRWTAEVLWKTRDARYSNLGSIEADAREAGENWGTLFERVMFQLFLGTADPELMPFIPNAPDGAPIFSETDGDSNDRFGLSGGNIESSVTFSTGNGLRDGLFAAIERMLQFLNPRDQPSVNDAVIESSEIIFIAPVSRLQQLKEAFSQNLVAIGPNTSTSNAAVTNLVMDSGYKVLVWPTIRLTTDTAFVISTGVHKPDTRPLLTELIGEPVSEQFYDKTNSRELGRKGLEGIFWEMEWVPVPGLPRGAVQLNAA